MKSNNLTISVPTPPCKRNCPYCVTKMTGRIQPDKDRFMHNMTKAEEMAIRSGVNNVLITGKGEPLDSIWYTYASMMRFNSFPIEIQTDGHRYLSANLKELTLLEEFDVVALSFHRLPKKIPHRTNNIIRLTLVVTDFTNVGSFSEIIDYCRRNRIDQLSLRKPTIPARSEDSTWGRRTQQWIYQNTHLRKYEALINEFNHKRQKYPCVRKLPFGVCIFDVEGISFASFEYCVQDTNGDDDIRSLIYAEDGHMYTSWTYQSSKIF